MSKKKKADGPPFLRPDTDDADIWESVYVANEYKLPERMDGMTVLDIGGHIGSFTRACVDRGAKKVIALEPAAMNIEQFGKNVPEVVAGHVEGHLLSKYVAEPETKARLLPLAIGQVDGKATLTFCPVAGLHSGHTLMLHNSGQSEQVDAITYSTLWDRFLPFRACDWCKIDAEGAEFWILASPDFVLRRVKKYSIEFHGARAKFDHPISRMRGLGYRMTWFKEGSPKDPNLMVAEFAL